MRRIAVLSLAAAAFVAVSAELTAKPALSPEQNRDRMSDTEWCRNAGDGDRYTERFCEVRNLTMAAPSTLAVSVGNGGVTIDGTSRTDVSIRVRIIAQARTTDAARALASQVAVLTTDGRVSADGPRSRDRESWWVSYQIEAPRRTNVDADTSNGSVAISSMDGTIRAESDNGSVRLDGVSGDVRARTSNGSVNIQLSGSSWSGAGLDAVTSNGSLRVAMPRDYNAHLVASTNNGSLRMDRPVTVQGRIGRDIDTTLGKGGATLRLRTSNGSLTIADK